jgi:hypothetical protein
MIKRKGVKAGVVLETILILAGVALIAKAVTTSLESYRFVNNADVQKEEAVIVAIGNHGLRANIQFMYTNNETIAFAQDGFFVKNNIGDHVTALYNFNNPAGTRLDRVDAIWGIAALFGLGGAILLLVGWRLRANRNL